jgi:hypothetical protein
LSQIPRKLTLVKFAVIYLPIIVGLIFTATGITYYLDASRTYPSQKLPKYGIINLASEEFSHTDMMHVQIYQISTQGNYVEARVSLAFEAKEKQVKTFALQVPHRVENAYAKIAYTDAEKTEVFYDQGDAKVEWKPESDVSIISYEFLGQSGRPWYSVEIGFRWFNAVTRTGYSSYELMVSFSRTNGIAADTSSGLVAINEKVVVMLTVNIPADTRLIDSIPPPSEEVIDWQEADAGVRSLVFVDEVDFGMTPGWPNLPSFRVAYEVPELKERYDRLVFDSGLFLGIGIQFLLAGIFDAVKLKDNK